MRKYQWLLATAVLLAAFLAACGGTPATYSVGGSISGLGAGKGITLSETVSGQTVSTASNGPFVFAEKLARGSAYKVEISSNPAAQGCVVKNGEGVVGDADVTNIEVLCGDSGTLDESFASGGKLVQPLMTPSREVNALDLGADGSILAAGTFYNGTSFDYAVLRTDADGDYDSGFAAGGKLTFSIAGDTAVDIVALEDGGALLVGSSDGDFAIAKIKADGAFDSSFGSGGKVQADFGGIERPVRAFVDGSGNITVVGSSRLSGTDYELAVLRLSSTGAPQAGFGSDGKALYPHPWGTNILYARDAVMLADGKIMVLGDANTGTDRDVWLARLKASGELDTAFATNGWASFDRDDDDQYPSAIALQADGKLVVAGRIYDGSTHTYYAFVARANDDGTLDTTFGTDGFALDGFGGEYDSLGGVAVQADGKIVAAGSKGVTGGDDQLALLRYKPDGSLDASFGDGGRAVFDLGLSDDTYANCLLIEPDGRILVGGSQLGDALLIVRVWQ